MKHSSDLIGLFGSLALLAALYLIVIGIVGFLLWLAVVSPLPWIIKTIASFISALVIVGVCGVGLSTMHMIVEEYRARVNDHKD